MSESASTEDAGSVVRMAATLEEAAFSMRTTSALASFSASLWTPASFSMYSRYCETEFDE